MRTFEEIEQQRKGIRATVNKLRSRVLNLAIQGKLVPQDPNDEPAIELLRRINKSFTPCDTSHYKNLPNNWTICQIKDVYTHTTGKALKKTDHIGVLRKYITTSNLYWNSFDFTDVRSMFFTDKELNKCTAVKGDLLICNGGDVGRAAIWNFDEPICFQNHISRLRPKHDNIVLNEFCYYLFMYLKEKGLLNGKGVAITSLSGADILSLTIPIPPFEEQKRIVNKIVESFDEIDSITSEL